MSENSFVPENHEGVFYLFARNHERLGFEKIVGIYSNSSPDIEATRNGEKVNIELEYKSSSAFEHYRALDKHEQEKYEKTNKGTWKKEGNIWSYVDKQNGNVLFFKEDKGFRVDESRGVLLYNTVKNKTVKSVGIDIIMYWEKTDDFKFWDFDNAVEPFPLEEKLKALKPQ